MLNFQLTPFRNFSVTACDAKQHAVCIQVLVCVYDINDSTTWCLCGYVIIQSSLWRLSLGRWHMRFWNRHHWNASRLCECFIAQSSKWQQPGTRGAFISHPLPAQFWQLASSNDNDVIVIKTRCTNDLYVRLAAHNLCTFKWHTSILASIVLSVIGESIYSTC